MVPLTIDYLDTENYGVWLTLSSFIAWFSFFDVGLGNGLRNKFAEANTVGNIELAKGYVSTAYYTLGSMCLGFFVLSLLFSYAIDWTDIFNTSSALKSQLQLLMPIVFGCFSLQLLLRLITSVYLADQNHSITGKYGFFISVGSLFLIWLLTLTSNSSLLLFGTIISSLPVILLLGLNMYAYTGVYKKYVPSRAFWKIEYFNDIFGQGISFFVIQIAVIILVSTDNLIITQMLGPEEVVPYNISYKYMGISSMILGIVLAPYWSSFTEAFTKGELQWIKRSMKNLLKLVGLTLILITVLVLIAPFVYSIWIGDKVIVPFGLTFSMALYFGMNVCYAPFVMFINGVGKIRLQMYILACGAIVNIPLSVFLLKYTDLGVAAVIIATTICALPSAILHPIQYRKLIHETAKGIWNK